MSAENKGNRNEERNCMVPESCEESPSEVLDMSKLYISKEASDNYRSYIEIKKKDINK